MAGKSQYLERRILDHFLGATASTAPATVYVALFNTNPTTDVPAGIVEVSAAGYARVAVTNNATNWPAATGVAPASKSNGTTILFGAPTANWAPQVVGFGIYDAASAGNLLWWGPLNPAKTVNNGDPAPSFAVGTLIVQED